jgi:hypothetical protein
MKRHLKVIMVVDGDEDEEITHVYLITCAELLYGGDFNYLEVRQNWDTLDTRSYGRLEVEWKLTKTNLDESKHW